MRFFIGAPLPLKVRELLSNLYGLFDFLPAKLAFVSSDNLHVTLKFLGDVNNSDKVINSLLNIKLKPFNASLENFSVFPNLKFIRVLHSPVTLGKERFVELHNKISEALKLPPEKDFTPHVTVARVKTTVNPNEILSIIQNITFNEPFFIDSFNLYESTLTKKGPIYKVVKVFQLKP